MFDDVDDIVILFFQAIEEIQDEGPVSYRTSRFARRSEMDFSFSQ